MPTPSTEAPLLPDLLEKEWGKARELIDKQDERIHDTRKTVFGLFASLLTASSVFASKDSGARLLWIGVHLSLLGLLLAGRFIEQQALLLQAATASRAFVIELVSPVELTGTLSDRHRGWAQRTTYVYVSLGLVSTVVAVVLSGWELGPAAAILGLTVLYAVYVAWLGRRDVIYARDGEDWSFSSTTCQVGDAVSILLTNLGDEPLPSVEPPAELRRLFDANGLPVHEEGERLLPPDELLDAERNLPPRRPCRWIWRPKKAGVWALKLSGPDVVYARRSLYVRPAAPGAARRARSRGRRSR